MKDNFNNEFFLSEDEKYGGLDSNNMQEALDYYQIEEIQEFKSIKEDATSMLSELMYHSGYRVNGKNVIARTIKSKNWDKASTNTLKKRSEEPKDTILNRSKKPADWVLSDSGKKYYSEEIKRCNELISKLKK